MTFLLTTALKRDPVFSKFFVIKKGGRSTVVQWQAALPHSKKFLGANPPVMQTSVWSLNVLVVSVSGCLSMSQPCDELVACPRFALPLAQCSC